MRHYENGRGLLESSGETGSDRYALALNDQGFCLLNMGRFDEAVGLYEEALAVLSRLHKGGHEAVATLHNNLGVVHRNAGRLEKGA